VFEVVDLGSLSTEELNDELGEFLFFLNKLLLFYLLFELILLLSAWPRLGIVYLEV
jgi:hypothetical protein